MLLVLVVLLGCSGGAWDTVGDGFRITFDHAMLLRLMNGAVDTSACLHRRSRLNKRWLRHSHGGRRVKQQVEIVREDIVEARGNIVVEVVQVLVQRLLRSDGIVGVGHGGK